MDKDYIWEIVKKERKNFLTVNPDPGCQTHDNQVYEFDIKTNIDNFEKQMANKATTNTSDENVTEDSLQTGAEMFTYLNFCPPKALQKFFKKLFLYGSTKDIILAVTNIIKTRKNAEKSTAIKIWREIDKKLPYLEYQIIDSISLKQTKIANVTEQRHDEESKTLG